MYKNIYLKKGKTSSLERMHPWIFSGAVLKKDKDIQEGDIIKVLDYAGNFMAVGHYQEGSICVRILSFKDIFIDKDFWQERLIEALRLRKNLGVINGTNNIFRLVHGEGDFLPGLVIDIYNNIAVIQAHSIGMHCSRRLIAESLLSLLKDCIDSVYYKSETTLPNRDEYLDGNTKGGFLIEPSIQCSPSSKEYIGIENGLKFFIDLERGQKTGFFIDQRDNRTLLEKYSKNKRVLNMFCYTGGFSVYALRGGAQKVVSVDSSLKAIDITNHNVHLNFPNEKRHFSYSEDAFKYLENEAQEYDVIVLDPPAFAKHKSSISNAMKGYTRLNAIALSKMNSGGILFTFSCSQAIDKGMFRTAIFLAAMRSGRKVRILHQLHQPADHPINIYHPEGEYLKGLVIEVI